MKGSYLILVLAVFLSCSRQNLELLGGRQRRETLRNPGPERKDGVSEGPEYAALSFDAEFDWPSSAAGEAVPFELVVYRGRKELRRYAGGRQNCIDANPDHHHLVSGRLSTQYSDAVWLSMAGIYSPEREKKAWSGCIWTERTFTLSALCSRQVLP